MAKMEMIEKKYWIEEQIGQGGGMGTVYRAKHLLLDKEVAIKVLHPHLLEQSYVLGHFLAEARILARLRHPHIVEIFDIVEEDDYLCLIMEFVRGKDLESLIKEKGPLPLSEIISLFKNLCEGLSYVHSQGIIHRDIKPANILIDEGGKAKLVDFGISKAFTADKETSQTVVGTPEFCAPEQMIIGTSDERSDIYGLGMTLLFAATGSTPRRQKKLLKDYLEGTDLNDNVKEIITCACASEPGSRYQKIDDLKEALVQLSG